MYIIVFSILTIILLLLLALESTKRKRLSEQLKNDQQNANNLQHQIDILTAEKAHLQDEFLVMDNKNREFQNQISQLKRELEEHKISDIFRSINFEEMKKKCSVNSKLQTRNLKLHHENELLLNELEIWRHRPTDTSLEDELRKTVYPIIAKNSVFDKQSREIRKLVHNHVMEHSEYCFNLSNSILSPNESRIYYSLKNFIEFYSNTPYKKYHIFPQVSMHSLINNNPVDNARMIKQISESLEVPVKLVEETISRKYMAKSIDFLICLSTPSNNKYKNRFWYVYEPVMGIEIDGLSHSAPKYGSETFNAQKFRDKEKDIIFDALGIELIRYKLNDDEIDTDTDYNSLKELISSILPFNI